MATQNYGGRNGMATIINLIRTICRVYTKFSGAIIAYINSTTLTTEQKAVIIDWLNGASVVCALIEGSVQVVYE